MEEGIEEREESEHPPVLNDRVPPGKPPDRRHRERQHQEAQRPDAGLRLQRFGRIGAEAVREDPVRQVRGRQQRRNEEQSLSELHGVD